MSSERELDLVARLDESHCVISRSYRNLFADIVEADDAGLWLQDGCRDMAEWIAGRYGISVWHAGRWVASAHKLAHLPAIAQAFEKGELGVEKVVELTRYATPENETSLIDWAKKVRPATIRHQADVACSRPAEEARETDDSRYLHWWWEVEGATLGIEGRLPAPEGAEFIQAIDAVAKDLPKHPDEDDDDVLDELDAIDRMWATDPTRSIERRRADALVLLATDRTSSSSANVATVVVHAELSALQGDGRGAVLEGGGPVIHAETARRLGCDCRFEVVAYDGGRTIGIKRADRNPPRWLRRQALRRDHGSCLFPGCGRSTYLQLHHIVPWESGGETNLDNLATLCHFHHKLVHEYGWSMRLGSIAGTAEWFRPDGRRYAPEPVLRAPPLFELSVAV